MCLIHGRANVEVDAVAVVKFGEKPNGQAKVRSRYHAQWGGLSRPRQLIVVVPMWGLSVLRTISTANCCIVQASYGFKRPLTLTPRL